MTVRRMAVLDEQGIHINTILVDERAAGSYSPGYGAKLVDLGLAVNCGPAQDGMIKKEMRGLDVLTVEVDGKPIVLERGDRLDLKTFAITKRIIEVAVLDEPILDVAETI